MHPHATWVHDADQVRKGLCKGSEKGSRSLTADGRVVSDERPGRRLVWATPIINIEHGNGEDNIKGKGKGKVDGKGKGKSENKGKGNGKSENTGKGKGDCKGKGKNKDNGKGKGESLFATGACADPTAARPPRSASACEASCARRALIASPC